VGQARQPGVRGRRRASHGRVPPSRRSARLRAARAHGNAFQDIATGEHGIDPIALCGIQTNMRCETAARHGGDPGAVVQTRDAL
jgi:nicotinamidase-related amidase